jgi:plastocyanin
MPRDVRYLRRLLPSSLLIGALALATAACGGGSDGGEPTTPAVSSDSVSAFDNRFEPERIRIVAGTEVTWTNEGRNDHNIVPVDDESWGVDPDGFAPGDVYRYTFEQPGIYEYFCSLHGSPDAGMTGAVEVTE